MSKVARVQHWGPGRRDVTEPRADAQPAHHYYAFLSYSHRDEATATWLHEAIEGFRVPQSLTGRTTENGIIPKRLTPVFRDRGELAAADDLGSEIRQALAASRYLVVLCSPAAAQSRWTNAEIEAFKRVRPEGCVLAAIVEGEPFASDIPGREAEECLPPALRHKYDRRGRRTERKAEPLAADLRGDRDARRLGFLKIVAGMLGVRLDELVQRETLRRQRRLAILAAASLAGMAVTSTLAIVAIEARDAARDQRREAEGLVGFMLGDLRDKLEPLGRLDVLDAVGTRALGYFEKQDKSSLSDEALAQRSKALTLMGEVANTRGDLNGALKRYQEALASTAETIRRHPDDPDRLFDHAQNVFWVGYIAYQRGAAAQAAERFREYKRLADRMVALAPDKSQYRLEQVYADSNLGTVLMGERLHGQAVRAFQRSLRPAEALAAAEPQNLDYQKQLDDNLAWLADAHENSGALEQALGERERQLQLLQRLAAQYPQDTYVQRSAMTTHRAIGRLLTLRGEPARGLQQSLRSVAISDALFSLEPDNTEWLQANVVGRFDLADVQLALGRNDEAATSIRSACDFADRLVQRDRTVADWAGPNRARCLTLRSRLALAQGQPNEALALARQALGPAKQSPKLADQKASAMLALSAGSSALQAAGRSSEAAEWARQGIAASPQPATLIPTELAELATLQLRSGNRAEAARILARLDSFGYRKPDYGRVRNAVQRI